MEKFNKTLYDIDRIFVVLFSILIMIYSLGISLFYLREINISQEYIFIWGISIILLLICWFYLLTNIIETTGEYNVYEIKSTYVMIYRGDWEV